MIETRTAVARLLVNLAILTLPGGVISRCPELFVVVDKLKLERMPKEPR